MRNTEVYHSLSVYEDLITEYLTLRGGSAPIEDVFTYIEQKMSPLFFEDDLVELPSGVIRWRKQVNSAREVMRRKGLIMGIPRETWELVSRRDNMSQSRFAIRRRNGWELTVVGKDGQINGPYTQREEQPRRAKICKTEQEYRAAIRQAVKERRG